jgi:hypothetical protein
MIRGIETADPAAETPARRRPGLVGFLLAMLVAAVAFGSCAQAAPTDRPSSSASPTATPAEATAQAGTPSPRTSQVTPSGVFTAAGTMGSGRRDFAATMLSDGRVLVTGGTTPTSSGLGSQSAEIYDPTGGTFTATGSMAIPREHQTATLLPSGQVLLAGGDPAESSVAELYDPTSASFAATGAMQHARMYASATLLIDGRVLLAGGFNAGKTLASAELYDPASGSFIATGSMNVAREQHVATLLSDGRVLIAGGDRGLTDPTASSVDVFASAEIYDPATGKFEVTGTMNVARSAAAAVALADGRVLIVAGQGDDLEPLDAAETYNPLSGGWSRVGTLKEALEVPLVVKLKGGRVLVMEGWTAELFDSETSSFLPVKGAVEGVTGAPATATLLSDGRVLVLLNDDPSVRLYWP